MFRPLALPLVLVVAGCQPGLSMTPESRAARVADAFAGADGPSLEALVRAMPKGGDLHNHTSGAVTPESMLAWGKADGACVDGQTLVASAPPCKAPAIPLADADDALVARIVTAWSMKGFEGSLLEEHRHFFDAFAKFGAVLTEARADDMLAEVRSTAGKSHQSYLELMQSFGAGSIGALAERAFDAGDPWDEATLLAKRRALVEDPAFAPALAAARESVARSIEGADALLSCGTAQADPGCDVDVRFLVAASRSKPRAFVFGQWVFAFELAQVEPRVVGVNLVSPEENPASLAFYDDEMLALDVLRRFNDADGRRKPVHVALHAGELVAAVLPQTAEGRRALTHHVRDAVTRAHAERIGHGVDVAHEDDADGLLATMADEGVAVEICLSSNDALLGVKGDAHPLGRYRAAGVPVVLATDDQGILGIDATHEFLRAAREHGLGYEELQHIARASLQHAFLDGASLWAGDGKTRVDACAHDAPGDEPSPSCAAFLQAHDKARAQWKHEAAVAAFERAVFQQ